LSHTFNGKYRRLSYAHPSPAVDTRFGTPAYYLHPEEPRGFTAREAARIQGFPDSFFFEGTKATQFKMIGNAVPPPVAESIATAIKERLL
jgi:DNA (cytosine-5)-methyltransferase 1